VREIFQLLCVDFATTEQLKFIDDVHSNVSRQPLRGFQHVTVKEPHACTQRKHKAHHKRYGGRGR